MRVIIPRAGGLFLMDAILDPLNDKQREAVLTTDGAVLVLAGAGSGKTRVITHRFAYLLRECGAGVNNILSVTFTNKAAGEMKERIGELTGLDVHSAWIRTFHSMGVMLLRQNYEAINYPRDFIIYDDTDSRGLVRTIMKSMGYNTETINPNSVYDRISSAKDSLEAPGDVERRAGSDFERSAAKIFAEYERHLRKNRAVDFADLIALPIRVFETRPDILSRYQERWRYMMIDEFQDTNGAQYRLVKLLAEGNPNICVVGDDDQSIYGWRGANIENIYDFRDRFKAQVIPLEQNYRSTGIILEAANAVVQKIHGRMEKKLWTERESKEKIKVVETLTDKEEAQLAVDSILQLRGRYQYKDFALFYRTNAQSRVLEESLLSANIPYRVFGGVKFYERKEIKDILAYIRLVVNPFDAVSFERIINVPRRKIGEVTVDKLKQSADEAGISYIEVLFSAAQLPGIGSAVAAAARDLGQVLYELNQSLETLTPMNFVKILIDAIQYKDYILAFDEDGTDRWSNVEELINSIKEYTESHSGATVIDFLNEVSLNASIDTMADDSERNYISLMTIHNAKGLEFPVVTVTGVVDGLVPHVSSMTTVKEMDEERRLFYVAITRARDLLTLSFPQTRLKYGDVLSCYPSPFLKDIPESLVQNMKSGYLARDTRPGMKRSAVNTAYAPKKQPAARAQQRPAARSASQERLDDLEASYAQSGKEKPIASLSELKVGDVIRHRIFGNGTVTFVSANMLKADFARYGTQHFSGNFLSSLSAVTND